MSDLSYISGSFSDLSDDDFLALRRLYRDLCDDRRTIAPRSSVVSSGASYSMDWEELDRHIELSEREWSGAPCSSLSGMLQATYADSLRVRS